MTVCNRGENALLVVVGESQWIKKKKKNRRKYIALVKLQQNYSRNKTINPLLLIVIDWKKKFIAKKKKNSKEQTNLYFCGKTSNNNYIMNLQ